MLILPSKEELETKFKYNPNTGELSNQYGHIYRKVNCNGGGIRVRFKGVEYAAHRIIWRLMTGDDPQELTIDHINRNSLDNKWCNLRLATIEEQQHNRTHSCVRQARSGRWRAEVRSKGKYLLNKTFDLQEQALEAVRSIKQQHWGQFAPG